MRLILIILAIGTCLNHLLLATNGLHLPSTGLSKEHFDLQSEQEANSTTTIKAFAKRRNKRSIVDYFCAVFPTVYMCLMMGHRHNFPEFLEDGCCKLIKDHCTLAMACQFRSICPIKLMLACI